jgi:8-oxo-dGTP pyrophosphatase MutT (NUDIX family)
MKKAVCVILEKDGKILGVSRKDNHNDFGLIGGKMDDTDLSPELAAIRETKEETGLDIYDLKLIDSQEWGGFLQHCFVAQYSGRINFNEAVETHKVEWLEPAVISAGSFGEYNKIVFGKLGIS